MTKPPDLPRDGNDHEGTLGDGGRPTAPRRVILVTGLSGAGKSSVLRSLEDLGYEAVDNPPLALLEELLAPGPDTARLATVIDSRTRDFNAERVSRLLDRLRRDPAIWATLVYCEAEDDILLRRYTETRRRHPMAGDGSVLDGIGRERSLLAALRESADLVLDTSSLPSPELRALVERHFGSSDLPQMVVTVVSFSFKQGLPREADLVLDVRFLRNPYYDETLRPLTGLDDEVAAHVFADPDFDSFFDRMTALLDPLLPRYVREGKKYLTVAIGCTGGRHRSVATVERLACHLRSLASQSSSAEERTPKDHQGGLPSATLAPVLPSISASSQARYRVEVSHRDLKRSDVPLAAAAQSGRPFESRNA